MKNLSKISKTICFSLLIAVTVMLSSCSKKMVFASSSVVPAAIGSVKTKTDKNKNTSIQVKVSNLAPASRLSPPKNTYVVWMVIENGSTKNIGQLKTTSRLTSKKLKASLETLTPFQPIRFFITAEDEGDTEYPGSGFVLETK